MLEDSVFAMLDPLGHLDNTVMAIVVVPPSATRSIHLDRVGFVHLETREDRSGWLDAKRERE
jgi:hypothetical protein